MHCHIWDFQYVIYLIRASLQAFEVAGGEAFDWFHMFVPNPMVSRRTWSYVVVYIWNAINNCLHSFFLPTALQLGVEFPSVPGRFCWPPLFHKLTHHRLFCPGGALLCIAPLNDWESPASLPSLFKIHLWVSKHRQISSTYLWSNFFMKLKFI